jgi:hypothetical protein
VPYGTRAPKELQHHLPALVLRRPSVSAQPPVTTTGARGSRMRDRRPPTYRCPAVPGLTSSARAILMALDSSVLPSESITYRTGTAYCLYCGYCIHCGYYRYCELLVASLGATLRQPAPSPVLHLLWLGTPLPNLPARASAARRLYRGNHSLQHCWYCQPQPRHCRCFNRGPAHGGP